MNYGIEASFVVNGHKEGWSGSDKASDLPLLKGLYSSGRFFTTNLNAAFTYLEYLRELEHKTYNHQVKEKE